MGRKRVVDASPGVSPADIWAGRDPEEFPPEDWNFDLGEVGAARVLIWSDGPLMMKYAVMQYVIPQDDEQHLKVARADPCHNEAHVHKFDYTGYEYDRKVLMPLSCVSDVGKSYAMSYDAVVGDWEENQRRWRTSGGR